MAVEMETSVLESRSMMTDKIAIVAPYLTNYWEDSSDNFIHNTWPSIGYIIVFLFIGVIIITIICYLIIITLYY